MAATSDVKSTTTGVAVVQAAPVAFDNERTLAKAARLTADAAARGAKLVLFPEAFLSAIAPGPISFAYG